MKKNIIIGAIVIALAFIAWQSWQIFSSGEEEQVGRSRGAMKVPVDIQLLQKKTLRDVGEFSGTLLARSRFDIAPKVAGRLEKLHVNIGDMITSGSLICQLEDEEYNQQLVQETAQLEVSQANLADAKSALELAKSDYERATDLLAKSIASKTEVENAHARMTAAEAKYQVAEAQIKQRLAAQSAAKIRLSYTRIAADWSGGGGDKRFVAERYVDEGTMLRANEAIVSIVDISKVRAVINVVEKDFPNVALGQVTTLSTDAYPGKEFKGYVIRKSPVLKEESRQARVEIEVPNEEGLLAPGMFVRVQIEFAVRENVLAVPASCLANRENEEGLFLADTEKNIAKFVKVKTGVVDGEWVEILEPELEGYVVTLGQHLLEDGSAILTSEPDNGSEKSESSKEVK
jgi:RND family efflux transporter MFP subunit